MGKPMVLSKQVFQLLSAYSLKKLALRQKSHFPTLLSKLTLLLVQRARLPSRQPLKNWSTECKAVPDYTESTMSDFVVQTCVRTVFDSNEGTTTTGVASISTEQDNTTVNANNHTRTPQADNNPSTCRWCRSIRATRADRAPRQFIIPPNKRATSPAQCWAIHPVRQGWGWDVQTATPADLTVRAQKPSSFAALLPRTKKSTSFWSTSHAAGTCKTPCLLMRKGARLKPMHNCVKACNSFKKPGFIITKRPLAMEGRCHR